MVANFGDDKPAGSSMIEQLVADVTCYALCDLDYSSLCQLSMTSSSMRKAANDDKLWKSLYHKEFTDQEHLLNLNPVNGWKAYYAATKTVMNLNYEFFYIIGSRSLNRMNSLWLNSDYVKCFNASGELFSGYDAVMGRWEFCFNNWEFGFDLEARDVQLRIMNNLAWVTTFAIDGIIGSPFHVTNVFELHNGHWLMVHHHSSLIPNHVAANH
ncbi:F-box protein SKIP8 [Cardamine amara subsp. amara]|uniref:F-box protein SKIP8 n=1 Tax=Cardamine amara subsp. amara TaxID=228776 RepID=A0ABD0Z7P6_CARAN